MKKCDTQKSLSLFFLIVVAARLFLYEKGVLSLKISEFALAIDPLVFATGSALVVYLIPKVKFYSWIREYLFACLAAGMNVLVFLLLFKNQDVTMGFGVDSYAVSFALFTATTAVSLVLYSDITLETGPEYWFYQATLFAIVSNLIFHTLMWNNVFALHLLHGEEFSGYLYVFKQIALSVFVQTSAFGLISFVREIKYRMEVYSFWCAVNNQRKKEEGVKTTAASEIY